MSLIPHTLKPRDSFFRDPYFNDTWTIMESNWNSSFQKEIDDVQKRMNEMSKNFFNSTIDRRSLFQNIREFNKDLKPLFNEVQSHPDKFQVCVDTHGFKPEEMEVKSVDNCLVIEAKHEEKSDNGQVFRQLSRKYTLPPDVKPEKVQCNLSSDGMLVIEAPRAVPAIEASKSHEKRIPIEQNGSRLAIGNSNSNSNLNSKTTNYFNRASNISNLNSSWSPNHKEHNIDIKVERPSMMA